MKGIKFEEVQSLLDSGKAPEEIFDWIDYISDGFRVIQLNNKWNYLDENNKLLSDTWFDYCSNFNGEFKVVGLNGKWNWVKSDGTLLYEIWLEVYKELTKFELNDKACYFNQNGELIDKNKIEDE